jgi:glycosyltransferase involved in cell wall biosynthesis
MRLSVLVPAYNAGPYIEATLESVARQIDWRTTELIVGDDCSTDDTVARVQAIAVRYPSIVLMRQPCNSGPGATRNALLQRASGEYVFFVDADDLVYPDALVRLDALIERFFPDLILTDYGVFSGACANPYAQSKYVSTFAGPSGQRIQDTSLLVAGLLAERRLHPWSKIARRALYLEGRMFPEGCIFEDVTMSLRLALAARSAVHAKRRVVAYRKHDVSLLGCMSAQKKIDLMASLNHTDLKERWPALDAVARFHWAHFATRNLIECIVYQRRNRLGVDFLSTCHRLYRESTPLSATELGWGYLRRGWLWRWLRFLGRMAQLRLTLALARRTGAQA